MELFVIELSVIELSDEELLDAELPVEEELSLSEKHDAAPSETAATVSTLRTVSKTFLAFFIKKSPFYLCFDYIIRRRICQ